MKNLNMKNYLKCNFIKSIMDFKKNQEFIFSREFINNLASEKDLYKSLISKALDNGLFVVNNNITEGNYFYPALNSGLPYLEKSDELHTDIFFLHDIIHYTFDYPILTGNTNAIEKKSFIAFMIMSEAFSMVLGDMFSVAFSEVEKNVSKKQQIENMNSRKIYPLFKSLNLDISNLENLYKTLYAVSYFALFNDSKWLENAENANLLYEFKEKRGDGTFNKNLTYADAIWDNYNEQDFDLKTYFDFLPKSISDWNTEKLANILSIDTENISFDKLFELFWNNLLATFKYKKNANEMIFQKKAALKYLSGQFFIFFKYKKNKYIEISKKILEEIEFSENSKDIRKKTLVGLQLINRCIYFLKKAGKISKNEALTFKNCIPLYCDKKSAIRTTLKENIDIIFSGNLNQKNTLNQKMLSEISKFEFEYFLKIS